MNILYYSWGENSRFDLIDALSSLGHMVNQVYYPTSEYLTHPQLEQALVDSVLSSHSEIIFTFNYLPLATKAAERAGVRYVCWVFDCPHYSLFSPLLAADCNYLFLFDSDMVSLAQNLGSRHAYHLPLAVNTHRLDGLSSETSRFQNEISFVGSLYEDNHFRRISYLPPELYGYLDGILTAQAQIWGDNLLNELLTPELVKELAKYIKYDETPLCPIPKKQFFLSMLQTRLTSDERISYLNALTTNHAVTVYTHSDRNCCPDATYGGAVSYSSEMPLVFANSKINLNLTLRSITSGIPLRALDVMSCGGFLLTNYQPELDRYFTNGSDYVYFESLSDMLEKADYYLSHPKERDDIAREGFEQVTTNFCYEHQLHILFGHL